MRIPVAEGLGEQFVSQDGSQVSSHDGLLLHGAVVLQGQHQGVGGGLGERGRSTRDRSVFQRESELMQLSHRVDIRGKYKTLIRGDHDPFEGAGLATVLRLLGESLCCLDSP